MKHTNIASSRKAAMFSARRRSQRTISTARDHEFTRHSCTQGLTSFDSIDALDCTPRPLAGVLVQISLLRKCTESILVGHVDLLALTLEKLDRFPFLPVVLRRVGIENFVGLGPEFGLLSWPEICPGLLRNRQHVVPDDVTREDELRSYFVKFHGFGRHERI